MTNKIEARLKQKAQVKHVEGILTKAQAGDPKAKAYVDEKIEELKRDNWSDLRQMYVRNVDLMASTSGILLLTAQAELMAEVARITDIGAFTQTVKLLTRDYKTLGDELKALGEMHIQRVGNSNDIEDMKIAFDITERYQVWMTRYESLIKPSTDMLLETLGQAQVNLAHLLAEQIKTEETTTTALEGELLPASNKSE